MPGPITPHVTMQVIPDGIFLSVKHCGICLPPEMAAQIGAQLIALASSHDPLWANPLPVVTPSGKPIT